MQTASLREVAEKIERIAQIETDLGCSMEDAFLAFKADRTVSEKGWHQKPKLSMLQVRYIPAVADTLNVTEVAMTLHTSQPGISKQIRLAEEALGYPVFTRSGKNITGLTEKGAQLIPTLKAILILSNSMSA